MIMII
jgi:predicted TPR repeat methyltransferase